LQEAFLGTPGRLCSAALVKLRKKNPAPPGKKLKNQNTPMSKNSVKKVKKEKRTITKVGKFYPTEPIRRRVKSRKGNRKQTKLRHAITPGAILIILSGRFRGRRVVFLKQLDSGLLLVTGPHKINGVPFRRVNQRYVIGTSTKVDLTGVTVPKNVNDTYFKKQKKEAKKEGKQDDFFATQAEKKGISDEKKKAQKDFDAKLIDAIKKVPHLKKYLTTRFTLSHNQYPHLMKF